MVKTGDGIKKCACHDEPLVMYGTVQSLYCTPEIHPWFFLSRKPSIGTKTIQ